MKNQDPSNGYTHHNQAKIIRGGHEYFEQLCKLFSKAENEIHLQAYILNEDDTGKSIIETLKKAAGRNVKIYVIVDGVASQNLSKNFIEEIETSGINFRLFEPLFKSKNYYLGRRLHHKIITIDNHFAIVGGMNIADRYNDMPEQKAWLDFGVMVTGEIVPQIAQYCRSLWKDKAYQWQYHLSEINIIPGIEKGQNDCDIRMRINDWMWHKNEITNSYIEMMRKSEKDMLILCSYFLPGKVMRRLLSNASKRGVHIKVVTTEKSDVWMVKKAEKWLYDWLLRNNIELFEYRKTVLHGKIAVADKELVTIGSYNLNNLSTYASIEFNLDFKNKILGKNVHQTIMNIIEKDCVSITKINHTESNNHFKQFSRWLSYQFIRLTLKMVTVSFKQHHQ